MNQSIEVYLNTLKKKTRQYDFTIDQNELQKQLTLIKERISLTDSFGIVLNMNDLSVTASFNLERYLGISDSSLSFHTFVERIHPTFRTLFLAKALAINLVMDHFRPVIKPNLQHYVYNIFIPFLLVNKQYYRVRQMSSPLFQDQAGNMTLLLNIYRTGLEPYHAQPMTSFFSTAIGSLLEEQTDRMNQLHTHSLHTHVFANYPSLNPLSKQNWGFSETQIDLLNAYAINPNLSWKQAAQLINRSAYHTQDLWNKKIKTKANQLFTPRQFRTIQDFVIFLKQMEILVKKPLD